MVLVHRKAYFPQLSAGRKLHHIWYGPFPVLSISGQNCTLELPTTRTRRSPTFHIKYLRHYQSRIQNGPTAPPSTEKQIAERTDDITQILRMSTSPAAAEVCWRNCETFDTSWVTPVAIRASPSFRALLDDFDAVNKPQGTNRFARHR